MSPAPARILLVDDHTLFREGVARLLEKAPEFRIVGQSGTIEDALAAIDGGGVDLVLLDYDLGSANASDLIRGAIAHGFRGRILILTGGLTEQESVELLDLGVAGIFLKDNSPDRLLESLRTVSRGGVWVEKRIVSALVEGKRQAAASKLTARDRQVMRLIAEGLSDNEIARRLMLSTHNMKAVLQQLLDKTGVQTRGQLARLALGQNVR